MCCSRKRGRNVDKGLETVRCHFRQLYLNFQIINHLVLLIDMAQAMLLIVIGPCQQAANSHRLLAQLGAQCVFVIARVVPHRLFDQQ